MKTHQIRVTPMEFQFIISGYVRYVIVGLPAEHTSLYQPADLLEIAMTQAPEVKLQARVTHIEPKMCSHLAHDDDEFDDGHIITDDMLIISFSPGWDWQ